jgi:hypothetical protein
MRSTSPPRARGVSLLSRTVAGLPRAVGLGAFARRVASLAALGALLAAVLAAPALAKAPSAATLKAYEQEDRTLANELAGVEGAKLGVSLPGGPAFFIHLTQSAKYSLKGQVGAEPITAAALTDPEFTTAGTPIGCAIEVAAGPHSLGTMRATIAHEVFHCFEPVMAGDEDDWKVRDTHYWLVEGAAEWAGAELAGRRDEVSDDERARYYEHPETSLFKRTYDAIGFYDHMQSVGISPWSKFKAMFAQENDESAYNAAVADNLEFLTTEASVFFREASGWPWAPRREDAPSVAVRFHPTTLAVGGSGHPPVDVDAYTDGVYHLVLSGMSQSKPVLELRVRKGNVRIRSSNGDEVDQVVTNTIKLCSLSDGCNCPGHDEHAPIFRDGDLAITGGVLGGRIELIARKRCETLLAAPSCETLLPGYTTSVADALEEAAQHFEAGGKFSKVQAGNAAAGFYSTTCLFLFDGYIAQREILRPIGETGGLVEPGEPDTEGYFRGAIASGVNASRYATAEQAKTDLQIPFRPATNPAYKRQPGIGEEAWLKSTPRTAPNGEQEYEAVGFVRVRNLTAYFFIAGNANAGPAEAKALLAGVAARL